MGNSFFLKRVHGPAVFLAALITQLLTIVHFVLDKYNVLATVQNGELKDPIEIAFLWYNLLAPALVAVLALIFERITTARTT